MIEVPPSFLSVAYDAECFPGSATAVGLSRGANCQYFAFEFVRYFGKRIPDFRSSELWEDTNTTVRVLVFEPFDLLLYNSEERSWGAHVGVFLGEGSILHLSKELGRPAIWNHDRFLKELRYRYFIGGKRILVKK